MPAPSLELQLPPFSKARIWFHGWKPALASSGHVERRLQASSTGVAKEGGLTLEAWVPRGARAEYGLLGFYFAPGTASSNEIAVRTAPVDDRAWPDSLAATSDDVRLGLPLEYAGPILAAAAAFAERRFPAGELTLIEAGHGRIGSSARFFERIVVGALSLILDDRDRDPKLLAAFLSEVLVGTGGARAIRAWSGP